jgi:hypothetical protein
LLVCIDVNADIYCQELGQALTWGEGLNMSEVVSDFTGVPMSEVVSDFTGVPVGPTFFHGSKPINGVWATKDIQVVNVCIMPAGFGVSDHRMFVVQFWLQSLVGASPPKVVRVAARQLNTTIPHVAERYVKRLEDLYISHHVNSRLIKAETSSSS